MRGAVFQTVPVSTMVAIWLAGSTVTVAPRQE